MKMNRIITLCTMAAALVISTSSLLAQDNNNNNGDQVGGQRRQRGGPGGGNWDPAQFQQRMVDGARDRLGFTNDTEWAVVEPLVKKVVAARADVGMGSMRGMMGGRNRGPGGPGGQANPEQEALQKAIDDNAPASQIKTLLAKYKASQKAKQAKLEASQSDLKKVLTTKQEAQAYLLGLVN